MHTKKNKSDVADATAEDIAGVAMSLPVVAQAGLKTTGLSDDDESTDTDDGEGKEESKGNLTELVTKKKPTQVVCSCRELWMFVNLSLDRAVLSTWTTTTQVQWPPGCY